MSCKRYREQIFDMALGASEKQNAASESELQRHLAGCAACRQEFERERRLAARIESTLDASLAAEPSPRMVAQVHQQIARNASRSNVTFWQQFRAPRRAAAVVACAILIAAGAIWLSRRTPVTRERAVTAETARVEQPRTENLEYAGLGAKEIPRSIKGHLTVAAPLAKGEAAVRAAVRTALRPQRVRTRRGLEQTIPQVLVPKNEMALVLQLYYGTLSGEINGASLVATPPGFKREPDGSLGIAPIEIKPIEIAKLSPASSPAEAP